MRVKHSCGLFGVQGEISASRQVYLGLYALQHRGQESTGIVACDGECFHAYRCPGLVNECFEDENLCELVGSSNMQPLVVDFRGRPLAVAHNGNLVNARELRRAMEEQGSIFQSTTDSEIFVHLMARSKKENFEDMIRAASDRVRGAYCLLVMGPDCLLAIRDPGGFHPLCLGRKGESIYFSSESCGLDVVGATYEREVEPAEMLIARGGRLESRRLASPGRLSLCVFELIYFSRPDSLVFGVSVDAVRKAFGRRLAREHPAEADIVISVPDSSNAAALGYAMESGLQLELGLIRNHYVGRTFIYPTSELRHNRVRIKFNPVRELLKGKRVVVVDDSIVRGTTSRKLMSMLRSVGVKEIHFRVSSPPIRFPCYYGIDTPTKEELIAASSATAAIEAYLGVDSLGYLSVEGMLQSTGLKPEDFCVACFTGDYPVGFSSQPSKLALEHFGDWSS
jgi:amidophosphoribosyltransferase